ncbi:Major sperm protein [Caenorhabditis elegans]|uniref:Major sperm protein n=1 Tax=Caenorhabditis elegans TaxID=6239 RepID=O01778_CAEEL|nr:Major sperm protein [Caenorhabditis elegans]CCD69310.1 Major sperm protein [Caenorhabditis elegans]|eukprot:NP_490944.1 Major sperm protein [Caenorhabditis elegans]
MAQIAGNEKNVLTSAEVTTMQMKCTSPDQDLVVYPRWLFFYSQNEYRTPLYVRFFVANRDPHTVAYNIKAREKIFKVDSSCGILKPGEKKVIKLFLMSSDDWPLAYGEYTQKRLKLAVECLRVPDEIQPTSEKESRTIARALWKRSYNEWPLERLYTKLNISLVSPINNVQAPATTVSTKIAI